MESKRCEERDVAILISNRTDIKEVFVNRKICDSCDECTSILVHCLPISSGQRTTSHCASSFATLVGLSKLALLSRPTQFSYPEIRLQIFNVHHLHDDGICHACLHMFTHGCIIACYCISHCMHANTALQMHVLHLQTDMLGDAQPSQSQPITDAL